MLYLSMHTPDVRMHMRAHTHTPLHAHPSLHAHTPSHAHTPCMHTLVPGGNTGRFNPSSDTSSGEESVDLSSPPAGRASSPAGRASSPAGRTSSPAGRTSSIGGRISSPAGRTSSIGGRTAENSHRRPVLPPVRLEKVKSNPPLPLLSDRTFGRAISARTGTTELTRAASRVFKPQLKSTDDILSARRIPTPYSRSSSEFPVNAFETAV